MLSFDFCLSTSIPVLTTSTYVVAWPQGDQLLGGGPWHKANLPATHWLSLPFYAPEGAWPLSQSTWVQRWSRDHGCRQGAPMDGSKASITHCAKGPHWPPGPCSFSSGDACANPAAVSLTSAPSLPCGSVPFSSGAVVSW